MTDRQTDGQYYDSQDRASIAASRGKNQLDPSSRFEGTPTCDRHADRHMVITYTVLAWRRADKDGEVLQRRSVGLVYSNCLRQSAGGQTAGAAVPDSWSRRFECARSTLSAETHRAQAPADLCIASRDADEEKERRRRWRRRRRLHPSGDEAPETG